MAMHTGNKAAPRIRLDGSRVDPRQRSKSVVNHSGVGLWSAMIPAEIASPMARGIIDIVTAYHVQLDLLSALHAGGTRR
jgi:hypothetical protein